MRRLMLLGVAVIFLLGGGIFSLEAAPGQSQIQAPSRPVILEFGRELCPMCEYMQKTLGQLKAKHGELIDVRLLHFDPDKKLFQQYGVVFVPTQIFLDKAGKEVFRHTGVFTLAELEKKLQDLNLLPAPQ